MEEWEEKYRKHLEETIPNGCYDLSFGNVTLYTGKGGYIDSLVALKKAAMNINIEKEQDGLQ